MLKTKVIVTRVNNLHDARYCAGMGVDWLALPIGLSEENRLDEATFAEIVGWIAGPRIAGSCQEAPLEGYQIDALLTANTALIGEYSGTAMLLVDFEESMSFEALAETLHHCPQAAAFVLQSSTRQIDEPTLAALASLAEKRPIFIGFGLTASTISQVIDRVRPEGIALTAGHEVKTGLNDFEEMADVLEAIEED